MGQRYGFQPLPTELKVDDFNAIIEEADDMSKVQLVKEWYLLDENSVPPEYVLQVGIFDGF